MSNLAEQILSLYGHTAIKMQPMEKGYRNQSWPMEISGGRLVNVIIYKAEPHILTKIQNANTVSSFLYTKGFPVRHTIDSRIVHLKSGQIETYAALYNYLPGNTIPWEGYTQKHLKLLGKTQSDFHAALQTFDDARLAASANAADEYTARLERMKIYFRNSGVVDALARKLGLQISLRPLTTAQALLCAMKTFPNQQALHMDFVRSNVLFSEHEDSLAISGVIDFEKTAYGHPVMDVARTLAFLLVDCKFKTETQVRKYFLYSGYHKRGGAPLPQSFVKLGHKRVSLLEFLVDLFLLYDFYKFLCHNPYESLPDNEHFVRTRNILLARKCLMLS